MFWRLCEIGLKQGLEISQTVRFAPFFFPFFFFEFRLESAVSAETGRFRPESARFRTNRPESEPHRRESAKSTWHDAARGTTRPDAQATASRRVGRRCGTSGAASVLHRLKLNKRGREAKSTETSERQNVRRGRELMFWHLCELG